MVDTKSSMPFEVVRQTWITRDDLRANQDIIYEYGDNAAREGQRGLARQMRHEPNAHAISVSWGPYEPFTLTTFDRAAALIDKDLCTLVERQPRLIVWPLTGLVPDFQSMPEKLRRYLRQKIWFQLRLETPA